MTAPARPALRTDRPPTEEQLLVLANRAERGPLTAAEADRLRQGIAALYAERRSAVTRLGNGTRQRREATLRLRAVHALVRTARQRGARHIPVAILAAAAQSDRQPGPPVARQRL